MATPSIKFDRFGLLWRCLASPVWLSTQHLAQWHGVDGKSSGPCLSGPGNVESWGRQISGTFMRNTTVVDHPLIAHKLTLMRRVETDTALFRRLMREVALLLGFEATRTLTLDSVDIETPLQAMQAPALSGRTVALISILRAGNGLLDGLLDLIPNAKVGFVGMARDETTLQALEYLFNIPADIGARPVIVLDPMLATGSSSIAAVDRIKQAGAKRIRFVCLLAAPEGIAAFEAAHPDVSIIAAAIDERLNEHGYILPGIGDAGDRLFGT